MTSLEEAISLSFKLREACPHHQAQTLIFKYFNRQEYQRLELA
jgi:hypothetical protein